MNAITITDLSLNTTQSFMYYAGLNLSVTQGECVILLGANGCGKSTLMRCLNGFPHDQGSIHILGEPLTRLSTAQMRRLRQKIGVVFQQFNLVQNVSVFQNVLYGALGQQRLDSRQPCLFRQ